MNQGRPLRRPFSFTRSKSSAVGERLPEGFVRIATQRFLARLTADCGIVSAQRCEQNNLALPTVERGVRLVQSLFQACSALQI
ncbi:MAG: hypothetical protein EOP39_20725 [Rubrivivax sp.]|nr:MAG: hypothetical protein EOP39_20725 [Rubrivivax sp.]